MTKKTWIALAALVLAAAAAVAWWTLRPADEAQKFKLAKLEQGPLQAVVAAAGTVRPVVQVSVGTQVSGQIRELLVDYNDEVKKGQVIARIDPQSFESKVSQATADVDAARATALTGEANINAALASAGKARLDADNAARDLKRKQDLYAQNFISIAEVETTRNTAATLGESLKVALAQVEVARAQARNAAAIVKQREAVLNQARIDLDRTVIRSPVNGVVIKRSVELGQTVAASLQAPELYIIAENLADMQVEVSIDEADIGRVRPGQPATFTVDAFAGRSFEGKVAQVRKSATIASNVVTYTVVVAFANTGSQLLPGMTANARIVTDKREQVLKVPNAALRVRIAGVVEPGAPGAASAAASGPGRGVDKVRPARSQTESGGRGAGSRGRVYVPGDDGKPRAIGLRLGISDGSMTEVLGVLGGDLQAGDEVLVQAPAGGGAARPGGQAGAGPRPPF